MGFVALNVLVSFKAHYEYTQMHGRILDSIMSDLSRSTATAEHPWKDPRIEKAIFNRLILKLNDRLLTFSVALIFHGVTIFCERNTVLLCLIIFNFIVFFSKIYSFHLFMTYPSDESQLRYFEDPAFHKDAILVSCLSLFLEIFGFIFIQNQSCFLYL
mmetsp:Transcript_8459/g.14199  ORF Transcript_8459/g.14199 Transcript_8459/m.14199 type:complete len:158 (+) Transcript_8459:202-675(+)